VSKIKQFFPSTIIFAWLSRSDLESIPIGEEEALETV